MIASLKKIFSAIWEGLTLLSTPECIGDEDDMRSYHPDCRCNKYGHDTDYGGPR